MAFDAFLKLDGITGESTDDRHKGWIDVDSYSFGISQVDSTAAGGGGAGKASFQDFHFVAPQSAASVPIFVTTATGQHIPSAVLELSRAGEGRFTFFTVKLTDVLITSIQEGGSESGAPADQFSLSFAKVEWTYVPQNPDGTAATPVKGGYDLAQNKKI